MYYCRVVHVLLYISMKTEGGGSMDPQDPTLNLPLDRNIFEYQILNVNPIPRMYLPWLLLQRMGHLVYPVVLSSPVDKIIDRKTQW